MNWKQYWDKVAENPDPFQQVARIGGKVAISDTTLYEMAARIAGILKLELDDHVLDVCCGNGQLTRELLPYCQQITGIDISEAQIERAGEVDGIDFFVSDVLHLRESLRRKKLISFDHIMLYFSFQYLETPSQASSAMQQMAAVLKPNGKILLGDVPEKEKLPVFYPNGLDRIMYYLKKLFRKNLMGRFWSFRELEAMAQTAGLTVERIEQPTHFPYAHYRADFLLQHKT